MTEQIFPTKGNLIKARKDLALSRLGYELMDRKRNILIRELMQLVDSANEIRLSIEKTYEDAYRALQEANVQLGVDIPAVTINPSVPVAPFGFYDTDSSIDEAYILFARVKEMTAKLAEVENGIYRLAVAIKKTQKRANALKNILIPKFMNISKYISDSLEEKEREEFSRLKVIKTQKSRKTENH